MRLFAAGGGGGTRRVKAGNAAMSHESTTTSPGGAECSCTDSLSSRTFAGLSPERVLVTQVTKEGCGRKFKAIPPLSREKKKATIPRAPGTMGFQWTWVQILTQPLSCCGAEAQILLSFFPSRAQDNADKCNPPTTPPWAGIMKSKHIMKVSDTGRLCYARSSGLL